MTDEEEEGAEIIPFPGPVVEAVMQPTPLQALVHPTFAEFSEDEIRARVRSVIQESTHGELALWTWLVSKAQ